MSETYTRFRTTHCPFVMRSECTNQDDCTLTLHGLILNSPGTHYDAWELSLPFLVVSSHTGIENGNSPLI